MLVFVGDGVKVAVGVLVHDVAIAVAAIEVSVAMVSADGLQPEMNKRHKTIHIAIKEVRVMLSLVY